jgi:LPS export ABC transporter permease LptF/LPS export ABC transporter permease LptG
MLIFDRYVCREVFSYTLLALLVLTVSVVLPNSMQLMELLVNHSRNIGDIGKVFLCIVPGVLSFTLPGAVLIGVLVGLSRLSSDSELVAMNAAGMSLRRLLLSVGMVALGAMAITFCMTLWLAPVSVRTLRSLESRLLTQQALFRLQPRVFEDRLPGVVLYVQDVSPASAQWSGVLLAESRSGNAARLTVAREATVATDRDGNRIEVHLRNGSAHEFSGDDTAAYNLSNFAQRDFSVPVSVLSDAVMREPTNAERSLAALSQMTAPQAGIELHRRLAFPLACVVFAGMAVPLGVRRRRGGRASALLLALLIVCIYYAISIAGAGLARQGALSPGLGIWAPNIIMGLLGALAVSRMEKVSGKRSLSRSRWRLGTVGANVASSPVLSRFSPGTSENRSDGRLLASGRVAFGQISRNLLYTLDFYLLRAFALYFVVAMFGFVLLYDIVALFDLLEYVVKYRVGAGEVFQYFGYLFYTLVYQFTPTACLIASLVTLGAMAQKNELVACRATGISLYRVCMPLLAAGLVCAVGLFFLDSTYLPYATQRREALNNRIKGRPLLAYSPQQHWIAGNNSKIYNYQLSDRDHVTFIDLSVFEIDHADSQIRRRVYAARAHWDPPNNSWILESGWIRDFENGRVTRYAAFPMITLAELDEPPDYFNRELSQSFEMNWWELKQYISKLRQAGFDVARLSVQLQEKLAFPLAVPIALVLAIPFSTRVVKGGLVRGATLALGVSFAYRGAAILCEALGAAGLLPPGLAAWSPDIVFLLAGFNLFIKMPT